MVKSYAKCMGKPLVRRCITGGSRSTGLGYRQGSGHGCSGKHGPLGFADDPAPSRSATAGDEVEDLFALLSDCKARFPGLEAVCSGAIASDYQRTRVENVCSRLGLVSLAPLWHTPQSVLLDGMVSAGIEAILLKSAAAGLVPRQHLGKTLQQLRPHLWGLRSAFGSNICGEGGEYETLTLDSPSFRCASQRITGPGTRNYHFLLSSSYPSRHYRVIIEEAEAVEVGPDPVCPVGVYEIRAFRLEPKGGPPQPGQEEEETQLVFESEGGPQEPAPAAASAAPTEDGLRCSLKMHESGPFLFAVAECSSSSSSSGAGDAETSAAALARAVQELAARGVDLSAAVLVHLYIPDMSHFGRVNAAYLQLFPARDPPSRACIQVRRSPDPATAGVAPFFMCSDMCRCRYLLGL